MSALTARARARAAIEAEIRDVARSHLADVGPNGLSLRAIARDLDMVSSAIYRYVPSRDALLTQLIVDAYRSVGATARAADPGRATPNGPDPATHSVERFVAIAAAVRRWAHDRPHEYGLIYGTPVPGYVAPEDTVPPAAEVGTAMLAVLADAEPRGADDADGFPASLRDDLDRLRAVLPGHASGIDDGRLAAGVQAWTGVFGLISFELFGHLHNVITDGEEFFALAMRDSARRVFGR